MGWYDDGDVGSVTGTNDGNGKRRARTANSRPWNIRGPAAMNSLFLQERLLLPFVDISLRYILNDDAVCILSNVRRNAFKTVISKMRIGISRYKLANSVKLAIERNLANGSDAIYSFRQPLTRIFNIPPAAVEFEAINIFNNLKVPSVCYVALIPTANLHGNYSTSPYDFRPYGLKNIKISFGGQSFPDFSGIKVNYTNTNPDWLEGYTSLLQREFLANSGIYPTYEDYIYGKTVYCFLLNNVTSLSFTNYKPRTRSAEGRLTLVFEPDNTNPNLSCLFFTLTDEQVRISSERQVSKGFIS